MRAPCTIEGCERRQHAHGWCSTHYMRWRKRGTTDDPGWFNTEESFWALVDRSGGPDACWPFTRKEGSVRGYGRLSWDGALWLAHRLAYKLAKGDPAGYLVRHRCDNPPCCNPNHLELGTDADNSRDREQRGRNGAHKRRGTAHPRAKLNEDKVRLIRSMREGGAKHREIGAAIGVSEAVVYSVLKRKCWAWVH